MIILTAMEISGRDVSFLAFPPCLPLVYLSVKSYWYILWGSFDIPPEPWWISSGMTNPTKCQGFEYATRHFTISVVTALIWKKNLLLNIWEQKVTKKSVEQSCSWACNNCKASQEITILWNRKIQYHVETSHCWSILWAILMQSTCSYSISIRKFWCYFPICTWVFQTVSFLQNFPQNLLFHVYHILLEIRILIIMGTSKEIKLFQAGVHKLRGARSPGSLR